MLKWLFRFVGNTVVGTVASIFFFVKPLSEAASVDEAFAVCLFVAMLSWPVGWCICWLIDNRDKYTFKI